MARKIVVVFLMLLLGACAHTTSTSENRTVTSKRGSKSIVKNQTKKQTKGGHKRRHAKIRNKTKPLFALSPLSQFPMRSSSTGANWLLLTPMRALASTGGSATAPPPEVLAPTTPEQNASTNVHIVDEAHVIFDFPVTYNLRVRKWVRYFQTVGRSSFRRWLERSTRHIPHIQASLAEAGLPTDIAYVAMIESGFSSGATSHANAMGMWQFIAATGSRYGLKIDWWIDERRDFEKATASAIGYMSDLFRQFGSWYLVAASYNMGENGVRRLIRRYNTNSFWQLADLGALPEETRNYVPKMLAAMLIAKAPALYGFRDLNFQLPFVFDTFDAPGGTDLIALARYLGVSEQSLLELNPELIRGFIPRDIKIHRIRIPKGSQNAVAQFLGGN